jgi:hypothetical protein
VRSEVPTGAWHPLRSSHARMARDGSLPISCIEISNGPKMNALPLGQAMIRFVSDHLFSKGKQQNLPAKWENSWNKRSGGQTAKQLSAAMRQQRRGNDPSSPPTMSRQRLRLERKARPRNDATTQRLGNTRAGPVGEKGRESELS